MSQPAMSSASEIAFLIDSTVDSMLMTTPFLKPREGWEPIPMMSIPSSVSSPTMAATLVVPISRPTMSSLFFILVFPFGRGGPLPVPGTGMPARQPEGSHRGAAPTLHGKYNLPLVVTIDRGEGAILRLHLSEGRLQTVHFQI